LNSAPSVGIQAAALMSIFLVWAGAGFGTVTFSTPFDMTAASFQLD
jgi:hypothetical protein